MKKICLYFLGIWLMLGVAAADEEIAGVWHLTEGEVNGVVISAGDVGMEMMLTLHEDGSMTMTGTDMETETGTWSLSGNLLRMEHHSGGVSLLEYTDGRLSYLETESGVTMYFERESGKPGGMAAVQEDARRADYAGEWTGTGVWQDTVFVPLSALDAALSLEIGEDQVEMTLVLGEEQINGTFPAEMAEGALKVQVEGQNVYLRLLQDGSLRCDMGDMVFALERMSMEEPTQVSAMETADFDGVWDLAAVWSGDTGVSPESLDLEVSLNIENGSVVMHSGRGGNMTWQAQLSEGILQPVGETGTDLCLYEDGSLFGVWEETRLVFVRRKSPEISPMITDVRMADFDGTWKAVYGISGGVEVSMEQLNTAMHLQISDGRVEMTAQTPDGSTLRSMPATLRDGVATVIDAREGTIMDLRLHENGMLSCTVQGTAIYFEAEN